MNQATQRRSVRSNPGQMVRRVAALAFVVGGCTASADEVRPPADQVFFPTGVAVSPDEGELFVVSANSQLQYDSGTVGVIDLADVDTAVAGWLADGTVPDGCERAVGFPEQIECDAGGFMLSGAGVRIGNFAASLAIQDKGGGDLRLVVPVRGDPSVTWIDWDNASRTLSCGDAEGFPLCDEDHRLRHFRNDDSLPNIDHEPFGVYVDSGNQYAVVTHLTAAAATLVDLPVDGTPMLSDQIDNLFFQNNVGAIGSAGVAGRIPGSPDNLVYVTARSEQRVQTFSVVRPGGGPPLIALSSFFFLDRVGANGQGSQDARQIAFGAGGDRGYVLNRLPPSVAVVDTSLDTQGFPRNEVDAGVDICREAVGMTVADAGDGERAYVTCFQDGEMYVVDPRNGVQVEEVATVGRGPFGIAAAPGRGRLYISNFFEHSIAVVDIAPGSPTRYRVVLRLIAPP